MPVPQPREYQDTSQFSAAMQELAEFEANIRLKKISFRAMLKGLINVTGLYRNLDENDSWEPEDIVEIKLTDEKMPCYGDTQCARVLNEKDDFHLYLKTKCNEIRGIDHYYVWQITSGEDSYYGMMLFPLKNGKYFKVSYNC